MPKRMLFLLLAASIIIIAATLIKSERCNDESLHIPLPEAVTLYRESACRIDTLGYEDYLIGCLLGEVSPAYGEEALRAAACAINCRTICELRDGDRTNGAQLSDEEHPWLSPEEAEEQYGGSYKSYLRKMESAVEYGMSHVLIYDGNIFPAPFCAISTGFTEDGGDCLPPRELPCDKGNDLGISTSACSVNELRRVLTELTDVTRLPADPSEWFSDAVYTDGGTLSEIRFGGARLTGKQLKEAFSLRSAAITVEYAEGRFLFTVIGIGDNLGMSLNAAADMAAAGKTAEDILKYFYPPAKLCQISPEA